MCGISGFIDYKQNSSADLLKEMNSSLHHRGPDDNGYKLFSTQKAQVGISHTRLSIIDLTSTGNQPMQYENFWIVFNGEIYNFKEIRIELENLGYKFVSSSDTEVILIAYKQWGLDLVNRLLGMFAIAIFDEQKNELICIRDRGGIKPFFYYWNDGLFLFASELKAFHCHPNFKKEINTNAIASFVQLGYIPAPFCIFKSCQKLLPGHYLVFKINNGEVNIKKYWDVSDAYLKPKLNISFAEAKEETEKMLSSAFEYRMISDVPVGVFLSGGYDSACLTAILQKNRSKPLQTFTIGVSDNTLNEAPYAKAIAKHLGTEHFEYMCSQKDALDIVVDLPTYFDEPFGDSSAIPTLMVSKQTKKKVKVALSADGGDEVFAGYNRYDYIVKQGSLLQSTPAALRKTAHLILKNNPFKNLFIGEENFKHNQKILKIEDLLRDPSTKNIARNLNVLFADEELKNLFVGGAESLKMEYDDTNVKLESLSPLSYAMLMDYKTYLQNDILQKVDRCSMSQSLESREPYLDHRLVELVAQLPDEFKYHKGVKKHILKEITHQYIPKELLDRPKMGFSIPLAAWLRNELRPLVETYFNPSIITSQGVFNPKYISSLYSNFIKGETGLEQRVWRILMFQMWHHKWMN
ncbi:MAG: asparagine synthase (glutamine-hydrolyzing) [Bacteroidota bacterium]|nr:asparagine synthase (glutamine-hydrolyzing) [Bacteroidota bacterium]